MDKVPYTDLPVAERMKLLRESVLSASLDGSVDNQQSLNTLIEQIDRLEGQLSNTLANARSVALVREIPFVSDAPVFGRFIVMVRNAWNWMSTKWWVRPILTQQNNFNSELVSSLQNALQVMHLTALTIGRLTMLTTTQQAEIRQLRFEVNDLQLRAAATTPVTPLQEPKQTA
jgi:hypothetical protein